jgi:hypothetical protein
MSLKDKLLEKMLGNQLDKIAEVGNMDRNEVIDHMVAAIRGGEMEAPMGIDPEKISEVIERFRR